ncbi:hypothetical protein HY624_02905 [Candidatus Uhrbacteria bacterium]|nr:hypothetical protein [Candidatus Uhrbacteria bacterium]
MLWEQYVWGRQTVDQLAAQHDRSERWVRTQLKQAVAAPPQTPPQSVVLVADMTFDRRTFGVCVFRSPHLKQNLIWRVAARETSAVYHECFAALQQQGFIVQAVVVDGRRAHFEVFRGIPIQMCHFHQVAIVTRYLTTRPKLLASQQLRTLTFTLTTTTECVFTERLHAWHDQWHSFLKEKTYNPGTQRWFYTHRRLRSAYRSLNVHLHYLFTFQRFPELMIPNTTNSLDGTFSHVKTLLRIHRGLNPETKAKMIGEILSK